MPKAGTARAVTNNRGTSIGSELAAESLSSQRLQIAVAFLSDDSLLERWLRDGKQLDILVARCYPTDPTILRALMNVSGRKIELKWRGRDFHSKLILGCSGRGTPKWASIGSANLTSHGLESNDEFNVILRDKDLIQSAADWFRHMWNTAPYVNPEELEKNQKEYDKVHSARAREPQTAILPPPPVNGIITLYKDYWKALDVVEHAVRPIIRRRFPSQTKRPYLAIWGFWHWVKYSCPKSAAASLTRAVARGDSTRRDSILRELFTRYSDEGDASWPRSNAARMRRMTKNILSGRLPDTTELFAVIDHGYRNRKEFNWNGKRRRLRSLRYLLRRNGEDVLSRAARVLHDPRCILKGAKNAAVFGWLGWAYPQTYPAMNGKAIDGLKKLGLL
jgi:HKD family nuclease